MLNEMKASMNTPAEERDERVVKSPNPIDIHVGSRIRLRRMLIGMSQEKLGDKLNLTFQQIQKYEKGANRVGASRLYTVAQILGVPVQFFFDDMPASAEALAQSTVDKESRRTFKEDDSSPFVMDFVSSSEGLHLNTAFSRISDPEVRRRVVDLVRALGESSDS